MWLRMFLRSLLCWILQADILALSETQVSVERTRIGRNKPWEIDYKLLEDAIPLH
jgi:hypothetical protein